MMARISAIVRSSTARPPSTPPARYSSRHPAQQTRRRGRPYRVRARLPAWRRGHRVEAGRRHLSVRAMLGLDQGPQSRQRRSAAEAKRELEQVIAECGLGNELITAIRNTPPRLALAWCVRLPDGPSRTIARLRLKDVGSRVADSWPNRRFSV